MLLIFSFSPCKELKVVVFGGLWPMPSVLAFFTNAKLVYVPKAGLNAIKNSVVIELKPEFKNIKSGSNENLEQILLLDADLYFGHSADIKLYEGLKKAGLKSHLFSVNVDNYDMKKTIEYWLKELENYFDIREKSQKLIANITEAENQIAQRLKGVKKHRAVILRLDEQKISVGVKPYYLEKSGLEYVHKNITNTDDIINLEELYQLNPEVIYLTNFTPAQPEDLINNKKWQGIDAIKNKRVYKLPLATYRPYAPNLDVAPVLLYLAKTNYPEHFKDIEPKNEFKRHFKEFYGLDLNEKQLELILHPKREAGKIK